MTFIYFNQIIFMKKILFMFAAIAAFVACGEEKNGGENVEPVVDPTLTVSVTSLEFAAEGEEKTFTLSANNAWTVEAAEDWLTISPRSGDAKENVTVTVTAGANETTAVRTASILVKSDKLTKSVSVSQDFIEPEPVEPEPDNSTYQGTTTSLKYASDLKDGGLYVIYSNHFNTKCWKAVDGQLTMAENATTEYTSAEVFEYKHDESGINKNFDDYGNWSAGYWKSVATGKYIATDFTLTTDLENALHVEYANNWGGNDSSNELFVFDVYVYPVVDTASENKTIWYTEKEGVDTFHLANNGYQNEGGVPTTMRKWVIYEVTKVTE